jgi:hypothetical protein
MSADLSAVSGGAVSGASGAWQRGISPSVVSGTSVGASLRKMKPPPKPDEKPLIQFAFNPERITLSHMYTNVSVTGTQLDDRIKSLGFLEIGIDKVYLTGPSTKEDADTLLGWSRPISAITIGTRCKEEKTEPAELRFSWGAELVWQVRLRSVNVTYTRFDGATGNPIRAEVRLGLYSDLTPQPPTANPTSGGPAGRSAHVLDRSECLASLAAANYDRPGAWRMIARANSIDDPLRVAPGTALYLPEPGELSSGASGQP